MIQGIEIGLRARQDSDVPVLQRELYEDVATRSRADSRPWRPISPGAEDSPYRVQPSTDEVAFFSVVELASGELAGEALLWGVDTHNRLGHLGLALRPSYRGRGLGTDVVRALCEYGFAVRGLQRLQLETLADNTPMVSGARRAGFTEEGRLRRAAWVYGEFVDLVIMGLLAEDWKP
jgi:RimJ/RimL family protein N-acetyltransferase